MSVLPTNLEKLPNRDLQITWSDGSTDQFTIKQLRDACPCATCRERRNADEDKIQLQESTGKMTLPVLSSSEARPLEITGMKPVGNYAYNIAFSDDHSSGIFTFEFLKQLGQT